MNITLLKSSWKKTLFLLIILSAFAFMFSGCNKNTRGNQTVTTSIGTTTSATENKASDWRKLSKDELSSFEEFLYKVENNGFVGREDYSKPDEIDLRAVLYDGAGFCKMYDDLDKDNQELVQQSTGWGTNMSIFVFTGDEIDNYLKKKADISFSKDLKNIDAFKYIEEKDFYLLSHTDSMMYKVTLESGEADENGNYKLKYLKTDLENPTKKVANILTLSKVGDDYMFVSDLSE